MQSGANPTAGEPSPTEEDAPILGLERFAALSADIESGAARDEVIAREGLSVEEWTRTQESWLGKMAEEASRKRFELTNRYNSAFVAQRRGAEGMRRPGKKKKGAPADVAAAPRIAAAPAFVAPPPSFVAPPPFGSSAPSPPPFASSAAPVAPPPSFVAPPAAVAMPAIIAPSAVAIHAAAPSPATKPADLGGTVAAEMISPFASGAPLPFKQGRAVIADAARTTPPPRRSAGRTIAGEIPPFVKDAIPFTAPAEPRAQPKTAPTAPLPPMKSTPRQGFDRDAPMDLGGTVVASSHEPIDSGGKLPFRKASDAAVRPPPAGPPAPGAGLPFRVSAAAPVAATAAPAAAIAPAAAAGPRATRFTIEQFASLSAEIAVTPAAVAQVRGRYGLDEASHRAEAEEWGRRFSADKELFARYGGLFQSYRDWLARSPR